MHFKDILMILSLIYSILTLTLLGHISVIAKNPALFGAILFCLKSSLCKENDILQLWTEEDGHNFLCLILNCTVKCEQFVTLLSRYSCKLYIAISPIVKNGIIQPHNLPF